MNFFRLRNAESQRQLCAKLLKDLEAIKQDFELACKLGLADPEAIEILSVIAEMEQLIFEADKAVALSGTAADVRAGLLQLEATITSWRALHEHGKAHGHAAFYERFPGLRNKSEAS